MRIAITGSDGFIGSPLCPLLEKCFPDVRLTKYTKPIWDIRFVKFDDSPLDVIINLAGLADIQYCQDNRDEALQVNGTGVVNVATSLSSIGANVYSHFIQVSTGAVYGDSFYPSLTDDSIKPQSVYGISKALGEGFLDPDDVTILRLGTVYGEGSRCVIDKWIKSYNNYLPLIKSPESVRNYIHIDDVCSAIVNCIIYKHKGVYNVCHENLTLSQVSTNFPKALITKGDHRKGDLISNPLAIQCNPPFFKPSQTVASYIKQRINTNG